MTGTAKWLAPVLLCSLLACLAIDLVYFPNTLTLADEQRYLGSAVRLATTGEFWVESNKRAFEMPGTAMFYAVFVRLFGADSALIPIRFAQAVLVVLQSILIGLMARRIFGDRRIAVIAAAIVAFYPFFLFYQGLLLSETLFNTFLIAGFAALYEWRAHGLRFDARFVAAAGCFAGATLTRATLTVLPPLLLALAAFDGWHSWRRAAGVLAVAALLHAAFLSPWWIRNFAVFGGFVPLTTGAGINFYIGNNPRNTSAGIDLSTDVEPDVIRRIDAMPDERDRQRAYIATAIQYILQEPAQFLRNAAAKFLRFWSPVPNAKAFDGGVSALISISTYGPVLLLALVTCVHDRRRWRALTPIYLLIVYFTLVHVITIASLRYRLPLEPFLILLAAPQVARLAGRWAPRGA